MAHKTKPGKPTRPTAPAAGRLSQNGVRLCDRLLDAVRARCRDLRDLGDDFAVANNGLSAEDRAAVADLHNEVTALAVRLVTVRDELQRRVGQGVRPRAEGGDG